MNDGPGWSGMAGEGIQTGLLIAAAGAPGTFEPSLVPRSRLDQGLITGLAGTLSYVLTTATQDAIEAMASLVVAPQPAATALMRRQRATLALDLIAIPLGLAAHHLVVRRDDEAVLRGLVRQSAWRLAVTGFGGVVFTLVRAGTRRLEPALGPRGWLSDLPVAVPVGLVVGTALEARRRRRHRGLTGSAGSSAADVTASAVASVVVTTALSALGYGERLLANATGAVLASRLPGGAVVWRPLGHLLTLGAVFVAGGAAFHHAIAGIEAGATAIEPVLDDAGGQRWVGATASGSGASLVPWASLGREGRRHVLLHPRPRRPAGLPPHLPDLSIETVMRTPAVAEPVLAYIGLDSAPTAHERVDMALAELDRLRAWDRSLLMLISPTGSGYVNYCATAAAAYLTRGDLAMVTMQYSKRPSPLSLFKIKDAREQNRLLWLSISARLRDRRGPVPRVVLFGESLGAHTSQDVLLHWGTLGPQALGIDRALWIGTPYESGWMRQVTGPPRPDVDPDLVAMVNDFAQIRAMSPARRARLKYVLVSHDNDGVTKFGLDLLASRPRWLSTRGPAVDSPPGASPRGIPASMRWRPLTTFLQSMIDMKNAQKMAGYRSWGHDYRPDLTRFVAEVFDLPATEDELVRIERALQEREERREQLFSPEGLAAMHGHSSA